MACPVGQGRASKKPGARSGPRLVALSGRRSYRLRLARDGHRSPAIDGADRRDARRRRCVIFIFRAASASGVDGGQSNPGGQSTGRRRPESRRGSVLGRFVREVPSRVREGRDEAVADAGHGRDEARVPIVVLELDAQAADVPVDDVALGDEVGAPDRVEDLVPGDDASAAAGEQVQQALLDPAQVDRRTTRLGPGG